MDCMALPSGELQWQWKPSYLPLWDSTMMNLCDLLVFGTTGEVARCTKFLISSVHNGCLWLDKAYPIHVEDIHKLTGLSMEGKDVSQGFQGSGKHDQKKGEINLYDKYGTRRKVTEHTSSPSMMNRSNVPAI
jgi:hypothetical protein